MKIAKREGWFFGKYIYFQITHGKKVYKLKASIGGKDGKELSVDLSQLMSIASKLGVKESKLENDCSLVCGYQWKFRKLTSR